MMMYFWTGLIILAPLALTFAILMFFFNVLTEPFSGAVVSLFDHYNLLQKGFLFLSGRQVQEIVSQVAVLGFLFFLSILLGVVTRAFFFRSAMNLWEYAMHKIPIISPIYKACQEITSTLFGAKTQSFKKVVMVPYPTRETYALGFVTQEAISTPLVAEKGTERIAVFVPAAPNPTSGFIMLYSPADLIWLDMKVEDAFKCVISCGVILAPFNAKDLTDMIVPETNAATSS